jgi:hypothetical protein
VVSDESHTVPCGMCQQQMPPSYLPSSFTAASALVAHAHTLAAQADYLAQLRVLGLQGMPAHSGQYAAAQGALTSEATPLWAASSREESLSRSRSQDAATHVPNLQPPSLQHEGFSERRWTQIVMGQVQAGQSEQKGSLPPTCSSSSLLSVRTESGDVLCLSKSACAARRALVRPQHQILHFVSSPTCAW